MKIRKRKEYPHRFCEHCGINYHTKRKWQRFCSDKCRTDYYWKTHKVVKDELQ